jgi:hypothetical protein
MLLWPKVAQNVATSLGNFIHSINHNKFPKSCAIGKNITNLATLVMEALFTGIIISIKFVKLKQNTALA